MTELQKMVKRQAERHNQTEAEILTRMAEEIRVTLQQPWLSQEQRAGLEETFVEIGQLLRNQN